MGAPKIDLRERTKSFALRVVRLFSTLPKTTEAQILGKQVLRSGTSIGAITARRIADEAKLNSLQSAEIACARSRRRLLSDRKSMNWQRSL